MASGASPSSNQRSSLPDDPLSADGIVAIGRKSRNPAVRRTHSTKIEFSESASPPSLGLVNCVVCGDRACSHYYYGVAACHGCKCFFWRSVKQQAQYICRYDKNCNITVNARNACRFCRFQRCINAGMQPESVRMSKDEKQLKTKKHSISAQNSPEMSSSFDMEQPSPKKPNNAGTMLLGKFFDIEAKAQEEADFNENSGTAGINNLQEIFDFPECMSAYRTKIMYCVRLHSVTQEEMNFCKFRTLTYASDYIRALSLFDDGFISTNDQISLLRSCYGSLTIFNIVYGTVNSTRETSLLCFPTGITVSKNEEMKTNSFVNHFLVANIIDTLIPNVRELCLTECEYMLIKAIIVLNDEGLSTEGKAFVLSLRDKVHATLYEQCQRDKSDSDAPLRFAKLLHLLPKISLLARDLAEHIKVDHTFNSEMRRVDPLFFELFGDIFQEERQHVADTTSTTQRPAFSQFHKSQAITGTYDPS
jgi:nuclear factor 4